MNNSISEVIEVKINNHFVLLKNMSSMPFYCKKTYEVQFENMSHEVLSSSQKYKVSAKIFIHNKVYHNKFILIILVLQIYVLSKLHETKIINPATSRGDSTSHRNSISQT
jgi:hypothetical protein